MLSLVPHHGVLAEIGVFEGQFSKEIYDVCLPRELVLIDIWAPGPMVSGDVDGNNKKTFDGEQLERTARGRMEGLGGVRMIKSPSTVLGTFLPNYFDMIYIDGDHSYEGVMSDLVCAARVIKDGGWIMGHDYDYNLAKTSSKYDFGVRRAVDEFCQMHGQAIEAVGYREVLRAFAHEISIAEAEEEIKVRTRQYARQQRTWLRRFKAIRDAVWVDGPLRTTEEAAREVIEKFFPARARER
jgi:hypothetical protein